MRLNAAAPLASTLVICLTFTERTRATAVVGIESALGAFATPGLATRYTCQEYQGWCELGGVLERASLIDLLRMTYIQLSVSSQKGTTLSVEGASCTC